jgi:Ca-activated chloride channel family protein
MRRVYHAIGLLAVLVFTATAPAQGPAPAVPAQGLGQLVVHDPQSGSPVRLNVARYHVHVVLQPPVALVQIDQSFFNPMSRQEEGTFVFNLPRGASVSRFAMYVARDRLMEGELAERQQAARTYETIVRSQRDPAILEQIGENLFKMRVFPIPANDTKRILLDFTLPLEQDHGRYAFHLPLFSDLQPVWDFQLTGSIRTSGKLEGAACPSHREIVLRPHGDREASFEWQARNVRPQGDFALEFGSAAQAEPALQSQVVDPLPKREGDGTKDPFDDRKALYFLATLPPQPVKDYDTSPADVLLLVSTTDQEYDLATYREAAGQIAAALRPSDRFRMACVDVSCRFLDDRWLAPGSPEAKAALGKLDKQFALGGSDLPKTLASAIKGAFEGPSQRRRLIVYLGSGQDSVIRGVAENDLQKEMLAAIRGAKAALFATPPSGVNDPLHRLENLATQSGGAVFGRRSGMALSRELAEWTAAGLPEADWIERVEIGGVAADDLFHPSSRLPGQPVYLVGRAEPTGKLSIAMTTSRRGQSRTERWEVVVEAGRDDLFVGRLWAQRRLAALSAQAAATTDNLALRQRIVSLSQQWSVLSPYTAFLVLETDQDYARWKIDRHQRRRYWKPADARPEEPLPADWIARVKAKGQEPRVEPRSTAVTAERFELALRSAEKAIQADNPEVAFRLLQEVKAAKQAQESPKYAELCRRALADVQRRAAVASLGPYRAILDPTVPRPTLAPSLWSLLGGAPNRDFAEQHPMASRLLRERVMQPGQMTVERLAKAIEKECGVTVAIDHQALAEVQIATDHPIAFFGWGKMSMRTVSSLWLREVGLTMIEKSGVLLITTPEVAQMSDFIATHIYPVADLLIPGRVPELSNLSHPYLDHSLEFQRRVDRAMGRSVSLQFADTPLVDVLDHFQKTLDVPLFLDTQALTEAKIATDQPITRQWKDIPAREALRGILRELGLTYATRDDVLLVTIPEVAQQSDFISTRLHSGRGVVFATTAHVTPRNETLLMGGMAGMGMGGFQAGMGGMGSTRRGSGRMGGQGFGGFAGYGGSGGFFGGMGGMAPPAPPAQPEPPHGFSFGGGEAPANPRPSAEGIGGMWPEDMGLKVPEESPGRPTFVHSDDAIDLIQNTVSADKWLDNGGVGTIEFFEPSFDFVVSQTDEVQEEVARLLERVRKLRVEDPRYFSAVPEGLAAADFEAFGPDFDSLIDLLVQFVVPDKWLDNGGVGTIEPDGPHVALVLSQTDEVHDQVGRLLTMLRRSRYEKLRGDRPWELLGGNLRSLCGIGNPDTQPFAARPASPEALKVLAVRRAMAEGRWAWTWKPTGRSPEEIVIARGQGGIECVLPEATFRCVGQDAAIAYPSLQLAERGPWGEELRGVLDQHLPWLPHRSNEELARMFNIEVLADDPKDAAPAAKTASSETSEKTVRLRLTVPDLDLAKAYIIATFSKEHGQPVAWEAYVDGKLIQRLRFEQVFDDPEPFKTQIIRQEDGNGTVLGQWELTQFRAEKIAGPDLGFWPGYVQFDRRGRIQRDAEFELALDALRDSNWQGAAKALAVGLTSSRRQPLLSLLWAWCAEQDERVGTPQEMRDRLEDVIASDAPGLVRFVAQGNFTRLPAQDLYKLLETQPPHRRTAADKVWLAQAAMNAGLPKRALAEVRRASREPPDAIVEVALRKIEIEALLQMQRRQEAAKLAADWAEKHPTPTRPIGEMGLLLVRYGIHSPGISLMRQALDDPKLAGEARSSLLRQWASFLLAEAQTTADPRRAADLCAQVIEMGQMPEDRLSWVCERLNAVGRYQRVIDLIEQRLLWGRRLPQDFPVELERAYRGANRPDDAERAATAAKSGLGSGR